MPKAWMMLIVFAMAAVLFSCADNADEGDSADSAVDAVTAGNDDQNEADDREDDLLEDQSNDEAPGRQCEAVAPVAWPEADIEDPSVISFDDNMFFTVDGQRFFPLGFYSVPRDAESLETFKNEGFNIALTGPGCCGDGTDAQVEWLELAQDYGIFIIMHPWSNKNDVFNLSEDELEQGLDERNDVGSLFGWYTFDEPALHRPDKELTQQTHYILSTYDPNHPDCLVEQAMDDFNLYEDDCGFFMIDPYPVPYIFLSMVKASMEEARAATEDLKPVVGVMQAFSWDWIYDNYDAPFRPTGLEMRNMAWQFIIFGARGLIPWNYAGDYTIHAVPEVWESYLADVAEMNELMRVILTDEADMDLDPQSDFPTMIDYVVKEEDTAAWVFSVSTNERSMLVDYDLSGIGQDLCVVDYSTGESFTQDADGRIQVRYDGLQVRILEIM